MGTTVSIYYCTAAHCVYKTMKYEGEKCCKQEQEY